MSKLQINMVIECGAARRWHVDLAERLRGDGHGVRFSTVAPDDALPSLALLEMFERLVYRIPAGDRRARERVALEPDEGAEAANLVIDLTGRPTQVSTDLPTLVPIVDSARGEAAAVAALLDRRTPALAVVLKTGASDPPRLISAGLPALADPACLTRSLAQICRRISDLLRKAVRRLAAAGDDAGTTVGPAPISPVAHLGLTRFVAASLKTKIAARLTRLAHGDYRWRIGWRRTAHDAIADTLEWPQGDFTFLPEDAARYFADPCVFVEDGVAYVFCEEYSYATGKGIISVFSIGRDGTFEQPRPVLEVGSHLSYPMVFRHGGAIWMIPESVADARIDLYRATRFPDRWTHAATLLDNVAASDATLLARDDRLWLFASLSEGDTSTWDALGLFHAPALEGPWAAHPANPVLIDAGAARPAGQMFEHGGALLRPAQDCRTGYGAGLALCKVERLDLEGYAQRVVKRFAPPAAWRAHGLHTYNAAADLEVVDCLQKGP